MGKEAVIFRTGKGGRKKLASLIKWFDSADWLGYAITDKHEQAYTLACSGRVDYPMNCEAYSFFTKEKNRATECFINAVPNIASMGCGKDRITNIKINLGDDPNILKFFSPLISRIEKLNKLEKEDERLKVCDIVFEEGLKLMIKDSITII